MPQQDMAAVDTNIDILPAKPLLGKGYRPGGKVRSFGRADYDRFRNLSPWYMCAGEKDIGSVHVDCRLLLKKSKLGVFDCGAHEQPGGIIYFNLDISQPRDCSLSDATVEITFDQEHASLRQQQIKPVNPQTLAAPVQVATWGPTKLTGEKRTVTIESDANGTASIQFPGGGIGGVGMNKKKTVERCSRWTLNSSLVRGRTGKLYQGLKWSLAANKFDGGSRPGGNVYTAFSFQYNGQPFFMKIKIEGKLDQATDRVKERGRRLGRTIKKHFGPRQGHAEDICTTLIGSCSERGLQLNRLADDLEREMEMKNFINGVPIEIPDAQTAGFFTVKTDRRAQDDHPAEPETPTSQIPPQKDRRPSQAPDLYAQGPSFPQIKALEENDGSRASSREDPTAPTLVNLFNAEQRYFRPPAIRSDAPKAPIVSPQEATKSEGESSRSQRWVEDDNAVQLFTDGRDTRPETLGMMARMFGFTAVRLFLQLLSELLCIEWRPSQKIRLMEEVRRKGGRDVRRNTVQP
ncbi:hypothetical protein JDV02_006331 [Purpureocillium takamizusanense]|uniref:Uncharacterized protein n=1 Tax=Purpureocillium takamizusanense TaxID=2060973 RepID=A0A9Q8VCN1_9HYPO|nr:uncharacterized protein JDV02_006331 [Purpureocillium takamizusanense]UNI20226.1 hypothetical protein JDV02_006331 [Purpureocillium takamizusanense]